MNIRYAKPIDKDQVVSVWNYCFEDGEDFVKYYFENVYDENNTIIIEENDEVLSALQLNKYTIDLRDNKYDVSYVVGVSSKPEVRGLGYMKHLMTYTLEELYKNGEIVKEIITLFTQNNLCLLEALDVLDSAKDALNFAVISDFSA